jgi:hypothetical protein
MKKKLSCAYLYADGHSVMVYEKNDRDVGRVQFVEIHERWTDGACSFKGRLIFGRYDSAMMDLCKKAISIQAHEPSVDGGSDNTKRLGIAYGYLTIYISNDKALHFCEMPNLISGSYTYQPNTAESCPSPSESHWGNYRIAKFHPAKAELQKAA